MNPHPQSYTSPAPNHKIKSYDTDGMGPRLHFAEGPHSSYSAVGYFCEMKSVNLATPSPFLTVKNGYTKLTLINECERVHKS